MADPTKPETSKQEEEETNRHLTMPSPPAKGFAADGSLTDKAANDKAMRDRAAILNPTDDRPSFEQIEADRAREAGEPVPVQPKPGSDTATVGPTGAAAPASSAPPAVAPAAPAAKS